MPLAVSLAMTSGTSATRCSPAAVSFGTPIRITGARTYPIYQRDAGKGAPRAPLRARPCATLGASSDDRQPDADLHQARRCRGHRSRRYEPCFQAPPARGGLWHGGRAERRHRPRAGPTGPPRALRRVARSGAERPARSGGRPVGASAPRRRLRHAHAPARGRLLHRLAGGGLRRGQRHARAAAFLRHTRRHAGGRPSAPGADRLPPRRAPRDRRRRTATPRWSATSTGSRTCCSSSPAPPTCPRTGPPSPCGSPGPTAARRPAPRRRPSPEIVEAPRVGARWP